ncbi:hypothetical protein PV783_13580 [Chitinophaga sp. CC14]|uniref:hypothetical protein n=1 Tax=Chitinophaga sp. CC14 TaxID=3029199 RepID=UPI003B75FDFB
MKIIPVAFFLGLFWLTSSGQTESIHLHLDKTIAYPGDTCWFRAYFFIKNLPAAVSTNLYVEVYNQQDNLVTRTSFPVIEAMSMGQLPVPCQQGQYWLRAYTRNSNFFIQSLTVRNAENQISTRSLFKTNQSMAFSDLPGLLITSSYSKGHISCTLFPDSKCKYQSKKIEILVKCYDQLVARYNFELNSRQKNIIVVPDSSLIRFHGFVSLIFLCNDTIIDKQEILVPCRSIPIDLIKDTGAYVLKIRDTTDWNYSLSVTCQPENLEMASITNSLRPPGLPKPTDTAFLSYQGIVNSTTGKKGPIRDHELVIVLGKDSLNKVNLVSIDTTGKLTFSGLIFFDSSYLNYMLNGYTGDKLSNILLTLNQPCYPAFQPPGQEDYQENTLYDPPNLLLPTLDTLKYLKPVMVIAAYKKAIDNRYATGRFSWPAHFSFDLIHANKYNYSILDYLNLELPWFGSNIFGIKPPTFKGHPVVFYLDEQLINWRELNKLYINDLAYVKVIEDFVDDDRYIRMVSDIEDDIHPNLKDPYGSDNAPSAMICVYRRKGKDFRPIAGNLLSLKVKGYDRPQEWKTPDRTTLLWLPYFHEKELRFILPWAKPTRIQIVVEGVNSQGEIFHFEKIEN